MKQGVAELLEEVSKLKTKKDKTTRLVEIRQSHPHVMTMLKYVFKSTILWDLPEGEPPYKPQPKESDLQNIRYQLINDQGIFRSRCQNLASSKEEE